jgi:hypothetical protein
MLAALGACRGQAPPHERAWPKTVALTPLERRVAGCYRVRGISKADIAETGFAADSILRLDLSVLSVMIPPQGPDIREYVNEHPFSPRPENFDTVWWRGHDETLHPEWRTPRQTSRVRVYGGGAAELRESGDSLIGETMPFRDAGPWRPLPIVLERLQHCPRGFD